MTESLPLFPRSGRIAPRPISRHRSWDGVFSVKKARSRLLFLVFAVLVSACSASICPTRHSVVHQTAMSCGELNQVTAATVKRLGYNIDDFAPATIEQPGKVLGRKRDDYDNTYTISVDMQCSSSEAIADAVSTVGCAGQISFPSDFQQSFNASLGKKVQAVSAVPENQKPGLRIEVEPLRNGDSAAGMALSAAGLMPVKVTINNRTARVYQLEEGGVTLTSQAGAKVTALTPSDAAQRVSQAHPENRGAVEKQLRDKALQPTSIDANGKLEGFLYVPLQAYRSATVKLVDKEAGEPEGFTVDF